MREEKWIQRRELYPFVGEVIINSKNFEDAEKLYEVIKEALRKENHRRNNDISFDIVCVGKR